MEFNIDILYSYHFLVLGELSRKAMDVFHSSDGSGVLNQASSFGVHLVNAPACIQRDLSGSHYHRWGRTHVCRVFIVVII